MSIRRQGVLAQTAFYGVSVILMRGLSFFMLPYITATLSTSDFGEIELLMTIGILGSVIFSLGLEQSLYRFCGSEDKPKKRASVASKIYLAASLLTMLYLALSPLFVFVVCHYWGGETDQYIYLLLFLTLSFELLISVPLAWLRMNDRCLSFCTSSVARAFIQASLIVVFLSQGRGVAGVLEAGLISAMFSVVLLYVLNRKSFQWSMNVKGVSAYFAYGLPFVGSGALAFCLGGYDRLLLVDLTSLEKLAIYAIAAKFALLVSLAMQPYGMWYMPKRFEILRGHDGQIRSHWFAHLGLQLCILVTLGIGLIAPIFIHVFLPDAYGLALLMIPLCVVWACFKEMSEYINIGCLVGRKTHAQLFINLASTVVGVAVMSLLAPYWFEIGVLLGLCSAHLLRFFMFFFFARQKVNLCLPMVRILLLFSCSIVLVAWQCFTPVSGVGEYIFRACVGTLIFTLVHVGLFYSLWGLGYSKFTKASKNWVCV